MIYALNWPSKQVLKIYRPVFYPGLCATFKYIKFLLINTENQVSGVRCQVSGVRFQAADFLQPRRAALLLTSVF